MCPQDMRYFFMMLLFLLISFGLTFSVLMSPASTARLNLVSAADTAQVAQVQVFGSLEVSSVFVSVSLAAYLLTCCCHNL